MSRSLTRISAFIRSRKGSVSADLSDLPGAELSPASGTGGEKVPGSKVAPGSKVSGSTLLGSRVAGSKIFGTKIAAPEISGIKISSTKIFGSMVAGPKIAALKSSGSKISGSKISGLKIHGALAGLNSALPCAHKTRGSAMKARAARLGADQGQAIVEAAVVMPAMMFMVLVIIQLTMLQHARIMTEYAAFSAARAGIVYNAEKDAMRRAASLALLPTMARTDTLARVIGQQGRLAGIENSQRSAFGLPIVHVEILNPRPSHFSPAITRHLGGQEIDFDDIRTQAAMANQLEIRIRYFYRMPIPFANQMLQAIWFAQRSGSLVSWKGMDMTRPEIGGISAIEDAQSRASGGLGAADMETRQQYLGVASAARARLYYFPLEATYTMRMQSNVFLKNVQ